MATRTRLPATTDPAAIAVAGQTAGSPRSGVPTNAHFYVMKVSNRHDFVINVGGATAPAERVLQYVAPVAFVIPAGLAGTKTYAHVPATALAEFTLLKNGVTFGVIRFSPGASSGLLISAAGAEFAEGDLFQVVAPPLQDVTLADVSLTIVAMRLG